MIMFTETFEDSLPVECELDAFVRAVLHPLSLVWSTFIHLAAQLKRVEETQIRSVVELLTASAEMAGMMMMSEIEIEIELRWPLLKYLLTNSHKFLL